MSKKATYRAPDGYELCWHRRAGHAVHFTKDGIRSLCGQRTDMVGPQAHGALCPMCVKRMPPQRPKRGKSRLPR